jgi:hypothetical protein
MRSPASLDAAGRRLWRSTVDVFDFTDEPHKVQILTQACRVADIVAELDEAADEAPLTVKGSMGQVVISPFIAEARAQRALLAQLIGLQRCLDPQTGPQLHIPEPEPSVRPLRSAPGARLCELSLCRRLGAIRARRLRLVAAGEACCRQ